MKLKQITLHDALQCAGVNKVYMMNELTEDTPASQTRDAEGFFIEDGTEERKEEQPQAKPFREAEAEAVAVQDEPDTPKKEKDRDDTICALYRAGWSATKIAKEVKCSPQTVYNVLERKGLRS